MRKRKSVACAIALSAVICCLGLLGCQKNEEEFFDSSAYRQVANLATYECYYHNVVEIKNDGKDYLFGLFNVGYKKAWFEYQGIVEVGIDVDKVEIARPNQDNVVVVTIPPAQVMGLPDVDENSFSEVWYDKGLITKEFTLQDMTEAQNSAQTEMLEAVRNDDKLLALAHERAKTLLEQYVLKIAELNGESWTVEFVEAKDEAA